MTVDWKYCLLEGNGIFAATEAGSNQHTQ